MINELIMDLRANSSKEKAEVYKKFFKTGKGDYGEGDIFLGVPMPKLRKIARKYRNISFSNLRRLLDSKIHEYRMSAGVILVSKYAKSNEKEKQEIFNFYLKNSKRFNSWDLVDATCRHIVGDFLIDKNRRILYDLARSKNLWEQRIAIVSTHEFIKRNDFGDALRISELLLGSKYDLVQKPVGWMLREIGKRDKEVLKDFLRANFSKLPRITLRYSIELFSKEERRKWLARRT